MMRDSSKRLLRLFYISLSCAIFYSLTAFAVNDKPLDELPNHCYFSSQIEQKKILATLPVPLISIGKIYFSCEAGLIWHTNQPVEETLIFTTKTYQFKQDSKSTVEILNNQQTSFLSKLLLGIMSGDQEYINNNFTVNSDNSIKQEGIQLKPKNNFLKKAVEHIVIQISSDQEQMTLNILQTDDTELQVRAFQTSTFEQAEINQQHCLDQELSKTACTALFNPQLAANAMVRETGN